MYIIFCDFFIQYCICEIIDLCGSNRISVLCNILLCKYTTIYSVDENVGGFQFLGIKNNTEQELLFIYPCDHLGKCLKEIYLEMKLLCYKI